MKPTTKLVMFALALRMNESGECWPAQARIARDTSLSERAVRAALQDARRAGWIAQTLYGSSGQGWRKAMYVACVPDHLDLSQAQIGDSVDLEDIADKATAQDGEVFDDLHPIARGAAPRSARYAGAQ